MNSCAGENGLKFVHAEGRGMNINEAQYHFCVCASYSQKGQLLPPFAFLTARA